MRLGNVTGLLRRGGDVVGVDLDGEVLEGDAVVIAMGPWSVLAAKWLPLPPVFGLKGHSIIFDTETAIPPEALFLEYAETTRSDDGAIDRLKTLCERIAPILASSRILASQACFRPVTQDGLPLIGATPGAPGAYVATGHSVWGILNAPATGEAMAELILDGATRAVDLSSFSPARHAALEPSSIQTVKAK
jgi:glycine/D-amino acid oxidase-like deaminating enzyme